MRVAFDRALRTSLRLVPFLLALPLARAGGVRIVDAPGLGSLPDIQTAVDAAIDGDVLVVGQGNYPGFVVDDKSVTIVAVAPNATLVEGTVEVRNLSAGRSVVLRGLRATAPPKQFFVSQYGLRLSQNAGHVRLDGCRFEGSFGQIGAFYPLDGGHGAEVVGCARTVFVRTTLVGGVGGGKIDYFGGCQAGHAGHGLVTSGSALALYESSCIGGTGGPCGSSGGRGGHGAQVQSYGLFAAASEFRGGAGGNCYDFLPCFGGNGGHGLRVEAPAQAQLLSNTYSGGAGGTSIQFGPQYNGATGVGLSVAGVSVQHPGGGRKYAPGAGVLVEGDALSVRVLGQPGDVVHLPAAYAPGWKPLIPAAGVWAVPFPPALLVAPAGIVPASGVLDLDVGLGELTGGPGARTLYLQGFAEPVFEPWTLGSPIHAVVLDRHAPPDCNGNGISDLVDVIAGGATDIDHNLVPDTCDPDCNGNGVVDGYDILSGTSQDCNGNQIPDECDIASAGDCNGNGVPDDCDIASGTSQDFNSNGIPDECEPNMTWYVDAAAPSGGNGSAAAPFQDLRTAIQASLSGNTVLVRDGLYVGPGNRGLRFGGRAITVRSENGPAACIIDCEDQDRAFLLDGGEPLATRIEGFTILHGAAIVVGFTPGGGAVLVASGSAVTIAGCIIRECRSEANGGALQLEGAARVEDCVILDSVAQYDGGAIQSAGPLELLRTDLLFNRGRDGGGVDLFGPGTFVQCRFVGNAASNDGGGLACLLESSETCELLGTLMSGNTAGGRGGAVHQDLRLASFANLLLVDSTLVDNAAGTSGGGLSLHKGIRAFLDDCVVWGNSAPTGAQVVATLRGGGSGSPRLDVRFSDVQGGPGAMSFAGTGLTWGAGSIDLDPLFVDPDGPDNDPTTLWDNDFRLGPGSPCVDAGSNALVALDVFDLDGDGITNEPVPFDLDGNPRFVDDPLVPDTGFGTPPLVDMGAYERQP